MDNFVGPYRILRLINRGGQGSVYLGYDKLLHRRVAIKIYHLPSQREARREVLREAQVVAAIDSPKVVKIHDVIEATDHLALVMEYIPGCNLEEFLRRVRPSLGSIVTIATDIAGALAIARQQHLVHGDVKAANVLITNGGRARLTDFGIARNAGADAGASSLAGSRFAISPEQLRGEPLDHRADLFALGCILYRMLVGEHPFSRDGVIDTYKLAHQPPRPVLEVANPELDVPPPLADIVEQLLHKDPQQRPANTRRLRQVLRGAARTIPIAAGDSLLGEARPCFRSESPEDIPPRVPPGLGQQGRSRLPPGGGRLSRSIHWLRQLTRFGRGVLGLAAFTFVGAVWGWKHTTRVTAVYFDPPSITIDGHLQLPSKVSHRWMVQEVKHALGDELGPLFVTGRVGAVPNTTIYSDSAFDMLPAPPEPQQAFEMALRCGDEFCVFVITRVDGRKRFNRQAILYPDMSARQWGDIVRSTTLALYR